MRTQQRNALVFNGFVTATGLLATCPMWSVTSPASCAAWTSSPERPARDADWTYAVQGVWEAYEEARAQLGDDPRLTEVRWMIEELRISYFAQTLKTAYPVSEKRIYRAIDEALGY